MTRNIAASVKARLLNRAKEKQEEFELFLVRFACERFLYRLSASHLRGRCTLKGAALLTLWMADPYRATRDLDLLAAGANDEGSVRAAMETICRVPCPEDGLEFDLETLELAPIRAEGSTQASGRSCSRTSARRGFASRWTSASATPSSPPPRTPSSRL